jgi:hypothetical protein
MSLELPGESRVKDKDYLRVIFERKDDGSYEILEQDTFTTGFNYPAKDYAQPIDQYMLDVWQDDEEDIMALFMEGLTEPGVYEAIAEAETKVYTSGWETIEYDVETIILNHKVQRVSKEWEKSFTGPMTPISDEEDPK